MQSLFLLLSLFSPLAQVEAAPAPGRLVYMMPINCSELLPDPSAFSDYFEAVARGTAAGDRPLSRRMFRILAFRERIADSVDLNREQNPVDMLIQKTVCFYRKNKDPLRNISFDDADFLKYMKESIRSVETKVEEIVFQAEFEKYQREEYERRVLQNRETVDSLRKEAMKDADQSFDRLSNAAKRKVRTP